MDKPAIPELPKTIEELESLLKERFKVLSTTDPISATTGGEWHAGDIALTISERECPFCGMQFQATVRSGCFGGSVNPHSCPNCNFPNNVVHALLRNRRNKKKKEG